MPPALEPLEPRTLLATVPAGFTETPIAAGLAEPTSMAFAPDGRLFVAQQTGQLRVIKNDALLAAPFVSLTVDARGERGLLGVAFDPNFATNKFVYVYYTVPGNNGTPAHNRVSRFTANGDKAATNSQQVIFELPTLSSATNHNGGAIAFGPDGKLYVAVGDNLNRQNAPNRASLFGKILRINANGTIPTDNPFFNTTTGQNKAIWATGLRNPFNFAFDNVRPKGNMFLNDVGQASFEEINAGVAGSNYGWPATEGPTARRKFRAPIHAYGHGDGPTTGDAIVGAAFYTPAARTFPKNYKGDYFFADLTSGWIRRLDPTTLQTANFVSGISVPVALAVKSNGALYYAARGFGDTTGVVRRIQYTGVSAAKRTAATIAATPASVPPLANVFSTTALRPRGAGVWESKSEE